MSQVCFEPFIHVDIIVENDNVYYQPCNVYRKKFYALDFSEVQQEFEASGWASGCDYCKNAEQKGLISRRNSRNKKYQDLGVTLNGGIQSISLRYGTLCNSTCHICNETRSSAWATKKLNQGKNIDPIYVYKKKMMPNIKDLLQNLDLSKVKEIEFHGGEPLLASYPWEVLDLIQRYDVSIKFNTNGTVWPDQIKGLTKYQSVEMLFSIDDIDDRFEFLRPPAIFKDVEKNVNESKKMGFKTGCTYVVSNINVYYLPEFLLWALKKFGMQIYGQFVFGDEKHSLSALPIQAQSRLIEKFNLYPHLNKILDPVIQEMQSKKSSNNDYLLNLLKNKKYKEVFPEWAEIINENSLHR